MLNRLSLRTIFAPNAARGGIAVALRYGTALAMVGIAEVLFRFVSRQIEALPPFIIFYPVLVVVCVLCGLAPALLALALCTWVGVSNGVGPLALGSFIFLNLVMFAVLRKLHHLRQSEAMAHSQMQELLDKTQAEREWYSLVLRSLAEEVYFTDVDGRYRYANHAVLNEFGYERVDGVPVTDILARLEVYRADGSPRPIEEAPPLRALKGEVIGDEEQIVRVPRTGEFRYRQVSASPVRDAGGNIIGSVSVVRDITERKRAEEALREADRRKDVFMSTLSHELRNPLAPIRTAAMVMESPQAGPEEIERARRIIVRQVTHMASLLDDLLEVSRYTRGDLVLRKSHVPLQQVLAGAIEVAQPLLQEKGHQLRIDVPDPSPVLEADPLRLTQVVSNLLTNAAKYTNAGGEIILACRADDQGLKLSVQDNGIGLAPESLDRIFEMFVQVESTRTQLQGGLGIGLALVKAIVELHGGRVEAQSEGLSRGSTFTISLPSNLLVRHVGTANKKSPTGHSPVFRILAADDNVDASKSLGMFLELSGNQVTLAHDGLSALRIAEQLRPEVIVLDIGMPGMNGYEVARELRKQPWAKDMFLIALTGWGQESDRAEAIEAGFDIHFTKPVDPSELQAALPRREDKK